MGKLEAGRFADILVVDGDPTKDITILQKKQKLDHIFKAGKPIDRTPVPPRKRKWYECQKVFLNGVLEYDEATGKGLLRQ